MNQKNNIFEELNKMRNLIHTKPGVVISEQTVVNTPNYISQPGVPIANVGAKPNISPSDENFKTKYPCVLSQPFARRYKTKDGSIVYKVNNITYFDNGRKMLADEKTVLTYDCKTEFKVIDNEKSNVKPLDNKKKYTNMVTDYSKKIQTSLGLKPTGQLSDNDLQKVLASL